MARCDRDWGPATKLVPTLLAETDPATLLVTVDDEYAYPPSLLAALVEQHLRGPHAAYGFAGQQIDEEGAAAAVTATTATNASSSLALLRVRLMMLPLVVLVLRSTPPLLMLL